MAIQKIQKVRIGDQVFEQLKQMIADGEWKPGDRLPSETELASQFGISRVTVRQALQKLSALSLIETRLGEGSFVRKAEIEETLDQLIPTAYLSHDAIEHVFEFREIIETASARLAARRADADDIKELRKIQKRCEKAADEAGEAFSEADLAFHFKIGEITGNPMIIRTNQILQDTLRATMAEVIRRMGCGPALEYHGKIIDAIEAHDEDTVAALMAAHIGKNRDYFPEQNGKEGENER